MEVCIGLGLGLEADRGVFTDEVSTSGGQGDGERRMLRTPSTVLLHGDPPPPPSAVRACGRIEPAESELSSAQILPLPPPPLEPTAVLHLRHPRLLLRRPHHTLVPPSGFSYSCGALRPSVLPSAPPAAHSAPPALCPTPHHAARRRWRGPTLKPMKRCCWLELREFATAT
ncbi:hypothetical protein C2845_PM07G08010 [Panicum miliaceum]|uniref:Uncharacterized protein n=1 Tax=Panicum miliaceum TaxID=4540 RepID=A0A3L6SKB5_PANMI|nr:hypothetical protein C2845_PM07G08010 [Panicum miliaceum]